MTRSQHVNNNYVKAPLTKETTTKKMVEPTRETAAVNAGTSTEGLCGDGGSYHPAVNAGDTSCTNVDLRLVVNTLCDRISKLEKSIMEQFGVLTALRKRGLRVDVGVQANLAEQDRSRVTYAEAAKSHTGPASKVTSSVPRQPHNYQATAEFSTRSSGTEKMSRTEKSR